MKVVLLQLPIQGHDFFYSNENIPAAAAILQALGLDLGIDVELVPNPLMSYGSDQAILQFLLSAQPDLIGMSTYLWNIERNLYLARKLKERLPECRIVLGGPEINPDNRFLLGHRDFDIGVVGEGEIAWKAILESFPQVPDLPGLLLPGEAGGWRFSGPSASWVSLPDLPSPFLLGCLDHHLQKVLWLETVRGCSYRCAYCYYHKQFPKLRSFPSERLCEEIRRALDRGIQEVVFLDPCLTRRPRLNDLLDMLAIANIDRRLHFHAECRLEDIDSTHARKMERAGFEQLEVGLQTIHADTLKRIHRPFDARRFLEGARHLKRKGIEVMVDLIAGLPGDTCRDICRSIDWVLEQDACDYLMIYPLALIAATELRQRAEEWGLVGMPHPPYLLTRGPGIDAEGMRQAFHYYAESMEGDISPLEVPYSLDPRPRPIPLPAGLISAILWSEPEQISSLSSFGDRTPYGFTLTLSRQVLERPGVWRPRLRDYLKENPFSLLSVEVPPDVVKEELIPLWELAAEHEHFADRDYTVTHTPYRGFLLFSRQGDLLWKWPDPREYRPVELPDGQRISYRPACCVISPEKQIPPWLQDRVAKCYPARPDFILWEPPEDN